METEKEFVSSAQRALGDIEKNLDAGTIVRLRAARRQALEEGLGQPWRARLRWLQPVGGLVTASIVFAIIGTLWFSAPHNDLSLTGMSDIELLAASENPDFFADLEFYDWLEDSANAGTS